MSLSKSRKEEIIQQFGQSPSDSDSPEVQVAFNLAKGSLPVRGDVDLEATNDCMRQGLEILAAGRMIPAETELLDPDTLQQIDDLMAEFWGRPDLSAGEAQRRFAAIIERDG